MTLLALAIFAGLSNYCRTPPPLLVSASAVRIPLLLLFPAQRAFAVLVSTFKTHLT